MMLPSDPLIRELLARLGAAIVERDRAFERIAELEKKLATLQEKKETKREVDGTDND